jgi:hypothetical protein
MNVPAIQKFPAYPVYQDYSGQLANGDLNQAHETAHNDL